VEVGGRHDTFEAKAVVVAVPVPPLRRIRFTPPLPPVVRRALDTIGFGPVTKTILRYDRRGWLGPKDLKAWGSDLPVGAFWDAGEEQRDEPPVLSVMSGGDLSRRVAALPPSRRVR